MGITLNGHFTYRKLLRFTIPTVIMMIVTSIYSVVDGLFVSNIVGKTAFAAVNIIWPFVAIMGAIGFMIGSGGSALISKTMGEGNKEKALSLFSMLIYITLILGVILAIIGIIFIRPIAELMGASGEMADICVEYGRILLLALPFYMLQFEFQSFMATAEKPTMGLVVTIAAGVANMALDALFMWIFDWGVSGAALATAVSQAVGGGIPLIYFMLPNKSRLRLGKTNFDGKALLKTCTNGSSELMSNISMSIVNILFNVQLMKFAGENGVAAYGVLMYVNFIFFAIALGYAIGVSPVIGFQYGAKNYKELKNLLKKSLILIFISSVALTIIAQLLAVPLSSIFVGYDEGLLELTKRAFRICAFMFLFCGFATFGSAFFTALNNGLVSAVISFLRTLLFQIVCVLSLPLIMGIDGIWLSVVMAELLAVMVAAYCIIKFKNKYHYA